MKSLLLVGIICLISSCTRHVDAEDKAVEVEIKKTANIEFTNGIRMEVEVADTVYERAKGLMHRKSLPENSGMLFIFDREQVLSFWMKDTFIPLSIGFFDKDKKLLNIEKMEPQSLAAKQQDLRSYQSKGLGLFALEVNQGWFAKNKIKPGQSFKILKPKSQK